jgi:outer membrane receptor protein involved in Fe transport
VLDEIIVSARRREEGLQTVPIAITAFTGESLEARGIDMVGSMNAMAPNLSVQGGQGREIESNAAFRVRGVPGVAVYVDGIDQTSTIGLFTKRRRRGAHLGGRRELPARLQRRPAGHGVLGARASR